MKIVRAKQTHTYKNTDLHFTFTDFLANITFPYNKMTETPTSPSTFVEMEPLPDISTTGWPPAVHPVTSVTLPVVSERYNTHTLFTPVHHGPHIPMDFPVHAGSTPLHTCSWLPPMENMQLCTSSETPSVNTQHELPHVLPTPGKEIEHNTTQVQGHWESMFDLMKRQQKL